MECERERESFINVISLALYSVPRVFHLALRRCETLWSAREIASMALSAEQARHTENVFHIALRHVCQYRHFSSKLLNNFYGEEQLKKSAVANVTAIPLPLYFPCFVLLRRF